MTEQNQPLTYQQAQAKAAAFLRGEKARILSRYRSDVASIRSSNLSPEDRASALASAAEYRDRLFECAQELYSEEFEKLTKHLPNKLSPEERRAARERAARERQLAYAARKEAMHRMSVRHAQERSELAIRHAQERAGLIPTPETQPCKNT